VTGENVREVDNPYIKIRECSEEDLATIRKMETDWADEDITYGQVAADLPELLKHLGRHFLVAEAYGEVIGFAYGSAHTSDGLAVIPAGERYFEVDELYVAPERRGQGIGGALLDDLLRRSWEEGMHRSLVYSATKDLESILRFYRKHGFRSWHVRLFR
jgi:GNAT superfamily N-acetyltransferase